MSFVWSYAPNTFSSPFIFCWAFSTFICVEDQDVPHGFLLLRVLSHLHIIIHNLVMWCCTLAVVQCTFFQSIFCWILLLLFDNTVLDSLHFILCFRRIFLISAEWLILSTRFMSFIRKPVSTHNDHQAENPKLKDRICRCYIHYLFFYIIIKFMLFMTMLFW